VTINIGPTRCPNVFDAGLPTLDYERAQHPDEAHDRTDQNY
jgi:hypothetical protein